MNQPENQITVPHLSIYYSPDTRDPDRPFFVDHDGPGEGNIGMRFPTPNEASAYVQTWLASFHVGNQHRRNDE